MRTMQERSQRPGLASSASSIGWAKASPTMAMLLARRRSTSLQSSTASNLREGRLMMLPPVLSTPKLLNWAVPCISGQAATAAPGGGRGMSPALPVRTRSPASAGVSSGGMPTRALPPAPSTWNRSSWRHITPLGMPVVPPV